MSRTGWRSRRRGSGPQLAALAFAVVAATSPGHADDPVYWMEATATASEVTVSVYETKPGTESPFLDAMIAAGPFSRMLSGFANEKIIRELPHAPPRLTRAGAPAGHAVLPAERERASTVFYAVSRYHDVGTARRVESVRDPVVSSHLAVAPLHIRAQVVEHLVPDWGWERGVKPTVVRLADRVEMDRVFGRDGTCLGFFKAGYTGQIGLIEFFAASATLDQVREELSNRPGMSGASILRATESGRLLAYSEFFRAPKDVARQRLTDVSAPATVEGGRAGMVVENYFSR